MKMTSSYSHNQDLVKGFSEDLMNYAQSAPVSDFGR